MRIVSADEIDRVLTYPALIEALEGAFRAAISVPKRHHHTIPQPGADATLLIMPAWTEIAADGGERFLGCKLLTLFPDNARLGKPSFYGSYVLMSGETGEPLALMDGRTLTLWRTAAVSALAAKHLAAQESRRLLMVGAGALAPYLVRAHASVRPIGTVMLWNRTRGRAVSTAFGLAATGIDTEVVDELEPAAREADIICCATLATEPLIFGQWLKKGSHLDLVGGFTPAMREADDRAIKRARVYVDTKAGALQDAGDIVQPIKRKVIAAGDIRGDLFDLTRGEAKGRTSAVQITAFKSVGSAIEDLAAAILVWRMLR